MCGVNAASAYFDNRCTCEEHLYLLHLENGVTETPARTLTANLPGQADASRPANGG